MRTLLPFLKPYRKECVFAPLFKLLEAVLDLFVPLIMAAIKMCIRDRFHTATSVCKARF